MLVTVLSAALSGTVTWDHNKMKILFNNQLFTPQLIPIFHLLRLDKSEHVCEDGGVHRQPRRVRGVRDHAEHVLQDVRVVPGHEAHHKRSHIFVFLRLVETLRGLWMRGDILKQLEKDGEAGICHVPHGVLERPDDRVQDQLELLRWDAEEGGEAVGVDRLEKCEEVCPVLGVLLEVLVDHVQGALEHRVEDLGDLDGDVGLQLVHHRRHHRQDFWFSSTRHTAPLVIGQDSFQHGGDEIVENHLGTQFSDFVSLQHSNLWVI